MPPSYDELFSNSSGKTILTSSVLVQLRFIFGFTNLRQPGKETVPNHIELNKIEQNKLDRRSTSQIEDFKGR